MHKVSHTRNHHSCCCEGCTEVSYQCYRIHMNSSIIHRNIFELYSNHSQKQASVWSPRIAYYYYCTHICVSAHDIRSNIRVILHMTVASVASNPSSFPPACRTAARSRWTDAQHVERKRQDSHANSPDSSICALQHAFRQLPGLLAMVLMGLAMSPTIANHTRKDCRCSTLNARRAAVKE